jgi:hypothetical protein
MKRKHLLNTLLFSAVILLGYVSFSSSSAGGEANSGADATGAEGATGGCSCHRATATSTIGISIVLDSVGHAVTKYKGGKTYSIKLTGTNNSTNSLPKHGFQIAVIKGATASATCMDAGTLTATHTPGQLTAPASGFNPETIFEHSSAQPAATGTGGTGTTYVDTIVWTAPAAGTGTVSIWACINAVNGTGNSNGDYWNNGSVTITEETSTSVAALSDDIQINAYPNPVVNSLQVKMNNAATGAYTLNVFDMSGRKLISQNVEVSSSNYVTSINTSNWAIGMYGLQIIKDGAQRVINIVKQ